ncbi:MAG: hypothetical protein GX628_08040 [Clostridiales bacterium]|nr:hypothetical protein [Clostridiales bacterium]
MPAWLTNIADIIENMPDFSGMLNISIAAGWVILAVIALRFLLKKAPKRFHAALWGLVAARLLLPFSIESEFSLIPSAAILPDEVLRYEGTRLREPARLDIISNPVFSDGVSIELGQTVDNIQVHMAVMTVVWLAGIAALLLYAAAAYIRLRRRVDTAVLYKDNIFRSENVSSPFVFGIVRPKIYLPFKMAEQDIGHVVAHEKAHIRRYDHLWKPLGFLLLTLHWFNPLMWLAYILFCRDIELACDEKVIGELDSGQRADYAQTLAACSTGKRAGKREAAACPFGEIGVKTRIRSVMNYKKPAVRIIVLSVIVCIAAAVCFLSDPIKGGDMEDCYYLIIGQNGVLEIGVSTPQTSGGCRNADNSTFEKGEKVWLGHLKGDTDLRGAAITAFNKNGDVVYSLRIPENATDDEIAELLNGGSWLHSPDKAARVSD